MLRIKRSTKKVTIYTVAGKEFLSEDEARKYERDLNEKLGYTYYAVKYNPLDVDSFAKDKTPVYTKGIIYAIPTDRTPSNLIYAILNDKIGPSVIQHVDEFGIDYGYINNWDIIFKKRLYSMETLVDFFDVKIDDTLCATIRFVDDKGRMTDEWQRDGTKLNTSERDKLYADE